MGPGPMVWTTLSVQYTRYSILVQRTSMYEFKYLRSVDHRPRHRPRLFSYKYKKCIMALIVGSVVSRGVCRDGRFGERSLRSLRLFGLARLMPSTVVGRWIYHTLEELQRAFASGEFQYSITSLNDLPRSIFRSNLQLRLARGATDASSAAASAEKRSNLYRPLVSLHILIVTFT